MLKREEFEARKEAAEASKQSKKTQQQYFDIFYWLKFFEMMIVNIFHLNRELSSSGKNLTDIVLRELAKREEANRSGKMTVIIAFYLFFLCSLNIFKFDLIYF